MRMAVALIGAALLAMVSGVQANETVRALECASLEHHHYKAIERWEKQAARVVPGRISEIDGRLRWTGMHMTVSSVMQYLHDWRTAYEQSQEDSYLARAVTLKSRASNLDCAWAG